MMATERQLVPVQPSDNGHDQSQALVPVDNQAPPLPRRPSVVVDAAARKWDELIGTAPPGFFAPTDADALGAYCVAWVFYMRAVQTLANEGLTIMGVGKRPVAHPMVAVKREQEKTLEALGDRLGLNPAARAGSSGAGWWAGRGR
jgi:P27 family predicted phage terminase small subunit